jgi:hypothetical protein
MAVGREGSLRWQRRRSTPTSCGSGRCGSTARATRGPRSASSVSSWVCITRRCATGCVRRRPTPVSATIVRPARRGRGAAPAAQGSRGAAPGQRDPEGGECFFRSGNRPDKEEVIAFVEARHDDFGVEPILRQLGIPPSTYYGWLSQDRDPSSRRRDDAEVLAEIREVHDRSGLTYGVPRVHAALRRRGRRVSRKRVERLMRGAGLQGAYLRKRWRTPSTRQDPRASPAPDLVERDFTAEAGPALGRRCHPHPLRRGRVLAGRGT